MNIQQDKKIDKYNLDLENVKQPGLIYDYSALLALEERTLEQMKNEYNVLTASKAYNIQKEGKTPEGVKATKDVVDGYVSMDKEVKELQEKLAEQTYLVKLNRAAVAAIESKKSAIQNLVKLQLSEYYSIAGKSAMGKSTDDLQDEMQQYLNRDEE